jgi:glucose-6-phosphate dehydrogenase assembly protein OpcA
MNGTQYLVDLRNVERELNKQMKALQDARMVHLQRARMSNLVIFCNSLEQSIFVNEAMTAISAVHPSRTILLVGEAKVERELTARVTVRPIGQAKQHVCVEMVTLHAGGSFVNRLPFAVRSLLIGDLPINLWWDAPIPPPMAEPLLSELSEHAQQVIYDSLGWPDPTRGVTATGAWIDQMERPGGRWRVASDLNWRRLKIWRRMLMQAFDKASAPGAADAAREMIVEHGPHAVIQAWLLVSWLSKQFGWKVQAGKVTPGVEMAWQFAGPQGDVRVRIRRLEEGPPEIRGVKIATTLDAKAVTFDVTPLSATRLSLSIEGMGSSARTIGVSQQSAVELIGRQLSDRERDAVFHESMAVARVMAQSVNR